MSKDYYDVLGVNKNSNQEEIKSAFRKKAHQYHPDKAGGNEAKFKEINEAYQVLGNEQKRVQYDKFGSNFQNAGQGGFGGFSGFDGQGFNINFDDLGDIFGGFGDIFGFGRSNSGKESQRRKSGNDLEVLVELDFKEAVFGIEKEIKFKKIIKCDKCHGNGAEPGSKIETCPHCKGTGRVIRMQRTILGSIQVQATCDFCHGEGKIITQKCSKCSGHGVFKDSVDLLVKIPAGIDEGEVIRLRDQGEAGINGGQNGDLFLKIKINPDKKFKRQKYDILSSAYIKFTQAVLGDKIEVETINGSVNLKIPAGTEHGKIFILKNKGIEKLHGSGFGDHLVEIKIKVPDNLNKQQKKLLEELKNENL